MSSTTPSNLSGAADDDPFLRLHKMSTTAGLGSGDYVAINGTALAALLFGIASCLVLWGSLLLLVIPAIAIICAIAAFVQISNSNGTQTGRGLAILGLLLALGMGGGFTAKETLESIRNGKEQDQVIALLQQFGALLHEAKYPQAYDLLDDRFRARLPEAQFTETWKVANASTFRGAITGATWNGLLKFDDDPLTGQRLASGVMLVSFDKIKVQERQGVVFARESDGWKIDQLPDIFPPPGANSQQGGGGQAPKKSNFIGPLAPQKTQ